MNVFWKIADSHVHWISSFVSKYCELCFIGRDDDGDDRNFSLLCGLLNLFLLLMYQYRWLLKTSSWYSPVLPTTIFPFACHGTSLLYGLYQHSDALAEMWDRQKIQDHPIKPSSTLQCPMHTTQRLLQQRQLHASWSEDGLGADCWLLYWAHLCSCKTGKVLHESSISRFKYMPVRIESNKKCIPPQ